VKINNTVVRCNVITSTLELDISAFALALSVVTNSILDFEIVIGYIEKIVLEYIIIIIIIILYNIMFDVIVEF
jgi:hypothetical protein